MESTFRRWIGIGALLMALGVGLGAFAAHALDGQISEHGVRVFEKAVLFHFLQSLGLLFVAVAAELKVVPQKSARFVCTLLVFGVFVFSGSLYLLAISGQRWLGMLTPIGGISFLVAWIFLGIQCLRNPSSENLHRS